ncbi:glycosyltransferase [uncultured Mediterranean phage]|nr:glycosyltransferase [uncultured Mediterranean phage]
MSKIKHDLQKYKPTISICTPTFNRRPFIPYLIKCFEEQIYPKSHIEWIIVDDGTDPIGDLVQNIHQVKYFYFPEKMSLGKKRNIMNSKCSNEIIIYMDDDDYYPPLRILHAVISLVQNPEFLCAGCSRLPIFYKSPKEQLITTGPFGKYHATAATFAFRKELLKECSYDEEKIFGEESGFLKDYTVPLFQLDPFKTIMVYPHPNNSIDKQFIIKNPIENYVKFYKEKLDKYVVNKEYHDFILNGNEFLTNYKEGNVDQKEDILQEMEIRKQKKKEKFEKNQQEFEDSIKKLSEQLETKTNKELIQIVCSLQVQNTKLERAVKKLKNYIQSQNLL